MTELRRIGGDYALSLIVATIAVVGFFTLLMQFAGVQPPGAAGFITIVVAAFWPANRYAARNGRAPEGGEAWKIALVLTVVTLLVNTIVASAGAMLNPGVSATFRALDAGVLAAVAAVVALFIFVAMRIVFPVFVKSALKSKRG